MDDSYIPSIPSFVSGKETNFHMLCLFGSSSSAVKARLGDLPMRPVLVIMIAARAKTMMDARPCLATISLTVEFPSHEETPQITLKTSAARTGGS
jgi:hypothetical protein